MKYCAVCNNEIKNQDVYCSKCGIKLDEMTRDNEECYELKPRFVFVYELLPSSFSTLILLILIFLVASTFCRYYHYDPILVIALFLLLFAYKEFKIFYRKFRYRNVHYFITNKGIEYVKTGTREFHFTLPYSSITTVKIQRNLATYLFGYGHILVKDGETGIYLDYISEVDKVYQYILDHTKKR